MPTGQTSCLNDETLLGFAGQQLDAGRAAEVVAHISGCADCRRVLASIGRDKQTPPSAVDAPLRAGMTLGRYVLGECVGVGGMGAVYRAHDPKLDRTVALKVLRDYSAHDAERAHRFLRERLILAGLAHPNIAQLLDGGTTTEGREYLVLEFVDGLPIDEHCARNELSTRQRLALFRSVCDAVHHAHQNLVVHRDLKPSNILVTADGVPKLVDFGIAKLLERYHQSALDTATGQQPMTPAFASPEQAAHEPPTTSSDVYSLGVILYSLLCGQGPYRLEGKSVDELLRAVRDQEPRRPSLVAEPRLQKQLEGDVDAVVLVAMRKSPADRYASAERLSEDLGRILSDRPTNARRGSPLWVARLFVRRNKAGVAASILALGLLLAFGTAALWQDRLAEQGRARAAAETLEAAKLGADAERMEQLLRVELLLPAHPLTPAYRQIRELVAQLSAQPPAVARAHAAFTLGRGHQLLGDAKAAHLELSRAWTLGLKRPEVARALAQAEGKLFERELALLGRIDDAARKQARLEALSKRYREPSLQRLAELTIAEVGDAVGLTGAPLPRTPVSPAEITATGRRNGVSEGDRLMIAARLALIDRHLTEAVTLAQSAEAAGADLLEVGDVMTEAQVLLARDAFERGAPETDALVSTARETAQRTIAVGRSAPAPRLQSVRIELIAYDRESSRTGFHLDALASVSRILEELEVLDPESGDLQNAWASVEKRRGDALASAGEPSVPAYQSAFEHAQRAVALSPLDPRFALLQVANTAHALAMGLSNAGSDPLVVNARGIEAAERARTLAPDSSGPTFNLAQLRAFRAYTLAVSGDDARAEAAEAVADAQRFVELGDRPVAARLMLAEALSSQADGQWLMGGEAEALLEQGAVAVDEAAALAPKNWNVFTKGIPLVVSWANQALAEGRQPEKALRAGAPWATALRPLAADNAVFAGHVGSFYLVKARAELLAGRNPTASLELAEPLLEALADSQSVNCDALAEAALTRASWALSQKTDAAPALRAALTHVAAAQKLDPTDADAWLLEGRALLAKPRASPQELQRALLAIDQAAALSPRQGQVWLTQARVRMALGDLSGARVSLERGAKLQPRLVEIAALRAALR